MCKAYTVSSGLCHRERLAVCRPAVNLKKGILVRRARYAQVADLAAPLYTRAAAQRLDKPQCLGYGCRRSGSNHFNRIDGRAQFAVCGMFLLLQLEEHRTNAKPYDEIKADTGWCLEKVTEK
jgi:hypothetical protein